MFCAVKGVYKMGLFDFIEHMRQGRMDFVGQRRAYIFQLVTLWLAGFIGLIYGYVTGNFINTFRVLFGTAIANILIVVPSWPWWNRHPVAFKSDKKSS